MVVCIRGKQRGLGPGRVAEGRKEAEKSEEAAGHRWVLKYPAGLGKNFRLYSGETGNHWRTVGPDIL